jgi:hypothetical protein
MLTCYIGSYVCMSMYGTFEPAHIGLNGVKSYAWAPAGFVKNYKHRQALYYLYLPLFLADRWQLHRDGDADTGQYGSRAEANRRSLCGVEVRRRRGCVDGGSVVFRGPVASAPPMVRRVLQTLRD